MKKQNRKYLYAAAIYLLLFVVWTMAVQTVDVKAIGPKGSSVGFSFINSAFHTLTGVNFTLYTITDWLGLVPVFICIGFAVLGLVQWIKRKSFLKVDFSLLSLGVFYIAVMIAYLFFEECVINYRPVLIEGVLEASYPSSTTLLTLCVMQTAAEQLNGRIKNKVLRRIILTVISIFTAFMVIARLISGVHWLTDIVGGAFLILFLVMTYRFVNSK